MALVTRLESINRNKLYNNHIYCGYSRLYNSIINTRKLGVVNNSNNKDRMKIKNSINKDRMKIKNSNDSSILTPANYSNSKAIYKDPSTNLLDLSSKASSSRNINLLWLEFIKIYPDIIKLKLNSPNNYNYNNNIISKIPNKILDSTIFSCSVSGNLYKLLLLYDFNKSPTKSQLLSLLLCILNCVINNELTKCKDIFSYMWKYIPDASKVQIDRNLLLTISKKGIFSRMFLLCEYFNSLNSKFFQGSITSEVKSLLLLAAFETRAWNYLDSTIVLLRGSYKQKLDADDFIALFYDRLYPHLSSASFSTHTIHPLTTLDLFIHTEQIKVKDKSGSVDLLSNLYSLFELPCLNPKYFSLSNLPFNKDSKNKLKMQNRSNALLLQPSDLMGIRLLLERVNAFTQPSSNRHKLDYIILYGLSRINHFTSVLSYIDGLKLNEENLILAISAFIKNEKFKSKNIDRNNIFLLDELIKNVQTFESMISILFNIKNDDEIKMKFFELYIRALILKYDVKDEAETINLFITNFFKLRLAFSSNWIISTFKSFNLSKLFVSNFLNLNNTAVDELPIWYKDIKDSVLRYDSASYVSLKICDSKINDTVIAQYSSYINSKAYVSYSWTFYSSDINEKLVLCCNLNSLNYELLFKYWLESIESKNLYGCLYILEFCSCFIISDFRYFKFWNHLLGTESINLNLRSILYKRMLVLGILVSPEALNGYLFDIVKFGNQPDSLECYDDLLSRGYSVSPYAAISITRLLSNKPSSLVLPILSRSRLNFGRLSNKKLLKIYIFKNFRMKSGSHFSNPGLINNKPYIDSKSTNNLYTGLAPFWTINERKKIFDDIKINKINSKK